MNDTKQIGGKKFIICVFGESSAGKSTLLRSLFCDIIGNSRYSICDAESFDGKDRRVAVWYRVGNSNQGIVAIGTAGDRWEIIKANIRFFKKHLHLWDEWSKNCSFYGKEREKKGFGKENIPMVLVTAARRPLGAYRGWKDFEHEFEVLNIPINVDAWYFRKEESKDTDAVEWMLPVRLIKESLLENIRYILIKRKLKCYPSKAERKINHKKIKASVSRD